MLPKKVGRYEIIVELGRGGMATVYHARDPNFKRDVAIKVLPAAFMHDPTFRVRFEREAQVIATLEYPGIVPVYDFGEENGQPYLVMRYMPGGSLSERLKQGPLSLTEASQIFNRLAPALDYVHSHGIIHRDLKPANILFDQHDNAFLSDFGIAHLKEASVALTGDALIGTPAYMSPEQARGDAEIDGRSDIYALGAILFEMLTSKQPYEATTPMGIAMKHITEPVPRILQVKSDLPPACETLIGQAMAKEREQRFNTANAMAQAITEIAYKPAVQPVESAAESVPPAAETRIDVKPARAPAAAPEPARAAEQSVPRPAMRSPEKVEKGRPAVRKPKRRLGWVGWLAIGSIVVIVGLVCAGSFGLLGLGALIDISGVSEDLDKSNLPTPITDSTTAVIIPSPIPTMGTILFQDDFSDPSSGWGSYFDDVEGLADYEGGSFRIYVDIPDGVIWAIPSLSFTDASIEVKATKVGGPDDNYFGLICRYQDDYNFYFLIISSDGYYGIGKFIEGEAYLVEMDGLEYSEMIHQGTTTNIIRADCVGNMLILYVNDSKLITVDDSDLNYGDVGLLAGTLTLHGTNILFDDFIVAKP